MKTILGILSLWALTAASGITDRAVSQASEPEAIDKEEYVEQEFHRIPMDRVFHKVDVDLSAHISRRIDSMERANNLCH